MTTSRFSIADGAVATHARHLEAAHSSMNSALTSFEGALAGLPKAWQGASFTSFEEVRTRWQQATAELNRALEDIRTRVATSAAVYDAGEQDQAAAIRHVGQSVDWSAGTFRH